MEGGQCDEAENQLLVNAGAHGEGEVVGPIVAQGEQGDMHLKARNGDRQKEEGEGQQGAFEEHAKEGAEVNIPFVAAGQMPGEEDADDGEGGKDLAGGAKEVEE